jgi:DNA repair protein RecO (recombination protein O)
LISESEFDALEQGYYTQSGTVLQRKESGKTGQSVQLFLKTMGPVWASAPAATSKTRFGGATEPLIWGTFCIYKSPSRLYLKNAEVKEDFLSVRSDPVKLTAAINFYKLLPGVLLRGHENDNALNSLWSALKQLSNNCPAELVEFRFLWRLLRSLGLCPSMTRCVNCGAYIDGCAEMCDDGFLCPKCSVNCSVHVGAEDFHIMQASALLSHDKFVAWSQKMGDSGKIGKYSKFLMTFFSNIN